MLGTGIAHALPSHSAPGTRPSRTYWSTQRIETPHLFLSSIKTRHLVDTCIAVSLIKLLLYNSSRR